jgi:CheY-like chemotaxis protein
VSGDPRHVVLLLSADAVGAALVGALVETLGYRVRFLRTPEQPDEAIRRERPALIMVDVDDPTVMTDETVGHSTMRGVPLLLYGSSNGLQRVQQMSLDHGLVTLSMPATPSLVAEALRRTTSVNL